MSLRNTDQGFDAFRRERKRQQAKLGNSPAGVLGFENQALRELEQVEAKEVLDQKLSREVHEFFMAATKQAATIVEKVARDAQEQAGAKIEQEMESFLMDALSRMNTLVIAAGRKRGGPGGQIAETQMEPTVANIVGQRLDQFRVDGTADVVDKHLGQDPFDTDVEDVQREFRLQIADMAPPAQPGQTAAPIEDHLVAAVQDDDAAADTDDDDDTGQSPPAATAKSAAATSERARPAAKEAKAAPAAAAEPPAAEEAPTTMRAPTAAEELERFRTALKTLVRQGTMTRDEARAAWQARLKAMGAS